MTEIEEVKLNIQHGAIWNALRSLEDGERIRGAELRKMTGVSLRNFYVLIEELQTAGCFVGASRNDDQGYYEIRTQDDMEKYLRKKRNELQRKSEALDEFEMKWICEKKLKSKQINQEVVEIDPGI